MYSILSVLNTYDAITEGWKYETYTGVCLRWNSNERKGQHGNAMVYREGTEIISSQTAKKTPRSTLYLRTRVVWNTGTSHGRIIGIQRN